MLPIKFPHSSTPALTLERFLTSVPFGPINNIEQTFAHPQALARKVTVEVDHPRAGKVRMVAPAVTYNGERMPVERPPPYLGQHTAEVLGELGYGEGQIEELRRSGVI